MIPGRLLPILEIYPIQPEDAQRGPARDDHRRDDPPAVVAGHADLIQTDTVRSPDGMRCQQGDEILAVENCSLTLLFPGGPAPNLALVQPDTMAHIKEVFLQLEGQVLTVLASVANEDTVLLWGSGGALRRGRRPLGFGGAGRGRRACDVRLDGKGDVNKPHSFLVFGPIVEDESLTNPFEKLFVATEGLDHLAVLGFPSAL